MYTAKITETIAHFIGQFEITVEETHLRKAYEEFKALQALADETPALPNEHVTIKAAYQLEDFDPNVPYKPVGAAIEKITVASNVWFNPPEIPVSGELPIVYPGFLTPHGVGAAPDVPTGSPPDQPALPDLQPLGSVSIIINQVIHLSDNDFFSVGDHGLTFTPSIDHSGQLDSLLDAASTLSPIDDLTIPATANIASFITTAAERLDGFSSDQPGVFVVKADTIEGTFVNGQLINPDDTPKLEDHVDLFKPDDGASEPSASGSDSHAFNAAPSSSDFMAGQGDGLLSPSVEIETGGNTLVNTVHLTNDWATSHVIAVAGDCVELNAIVQINAWCDSDSIGSAINGWSLDQSDPTESFNIAMFQHVDPSPDGAAATPSGGFPTSWSVTEITGDLVIMNWIKQFTFMTDDDIGIASSSGVHTMVTSGENTAISDVSLQEFGLYYDLIIVGGNIYDANIIHQMNVLLDNDLIGAVAGFETDGEGSLSTGGNLLWNQAAIVNGSSNFEAMPQDYVTAAHNLAAGNHDNPGGLLNDAAFAGLETLRVLYIAGDLLNLQYISQTNVLGDSDTLALAMDQFIAHPEAQWTISTGADQLVNFATIDNADPTGTTYVGGEHYSDEILIQAELISSEPDLMSQDPDALVNEAVAFLGDDAPDTGLGHDPEIHGTLVPDNSQADPMQSMLG